MDKLTVFGRITKVDLAKHEVTGVAMDETPDRDGEIYDYDSSKPYVQAWSDGFVQTTKAAGQEVSYGNIRSMHSNIAAGKIVAPLGFDDGRKAVTIVAKITDDKEWEKCADGTYTGFSVKGRLVGKKWRDGAHMRYTVDPIEISNVDLPCNPGATFTAVKADGSTEERLFKRDEVEKRDFSERRRHDLAESGKALPDGSFPIESIADLHNAIQAVGRAKDYEAAKKHIMERARALDATDQLPAGWSAEKSATAADLKKLLDDGAAILKRLTTQTAKEAANMTEAEKQAAAAAEIEKKADHLAKAMVAHEEIGKCLDGSCNHKGIGKCMEKMAGEHEKLGNSLEKMAAAKEDESDEDKAAKAAKAEETKKAAEKKAADQAEILKRAKELGLTVVSEPAADTQIAELTKKVAELTELVAKGGATTTTERKKPILHGRTVSKADDGPNSEDEGVKKFAEIKKDAPDASKQAVKAVMSAEPVLVD